MKAPFSMALLLITLYSFIGQAQHPERVISETGKFNTGTVAYEAFISGNYAYVTTNAGVAIFKILDKTNPEHIGTIKTKGAALGIRGRDQKIYFTTYDGSFSIADIRNPEKPEIIGSVNNLGRCMSIGINNSFAYINQYDGKMLIFNIENPANPRQVNTVGLLMEGQDILCMENVLYVAVEGRGLLVFDVTNPANPELKKEISVDGNAKCLDVYKNLLIVGSRSGPVNIFNISDRFSPLNISRINDIGDAFGVKAEDDKLFIATERRKSVLVYSIGNPDHPVFLNRIEFSLPTHDVYYKERYIYVIGVDGLHIFIFLEKNRIVF